MEDDQTGSLWSQITGECIRGELEGKKLELFPAEYATFVNAKNRHEIKFLAKPEKGPGHSAYRKYFEDQNRTGLFGHRYEDTLLHPKQLIYGLRKEDHQIAVPDTIFSAKPAYLIELDTLQIVLIRDKDNNAAAYLLPATRGFRWRLELDGQSIKILSGGDPDTVFEFRDGLQSEGKTLKSFPVVTAFWFAWKSFFPKTEIYMTE